MIRDYLSAGYPALYVLTQEPARAQNILQCDDTVSFHVWDCINGIQDTAHRVIEEATDPLDAIKWLDAGRETALLAHNLHLFMDSVEVIQAIQNGILKWKAQGNCLIVIAPYCKITPELEKVFHLIDIPLPGVMELFNIQQDISTSMGIETNYNAAVSAKGLTEFEAETAFAYSLIKERRFNPQIIAEAKAQMIRKSGLMEFWPPVPITQVGGIQPVKDYLLSRKKAFQERSTWLPRLKGILLVGIPGTGKSLFAKAAASIMEWPLIRLNISTLKNSLVGESERRMEAACRTIDAFGEAIIWCDEIEKALAGARNSGETGDTTGSMLGILLTWMQETTTPCILVATANNITQLPTEFIRRFDDVFFMDTPTTEERREIVRIMNARYQADLPLTDNFLRNTNGFTGAEIEKLAKKSLFDGIDRAIEQTIPISKTMKEEIEALRSWAQTRAIKANTLETAAEGRRIRMDGEQKPEVGCRKVEKGLI